ncbi:heterogeneous nuclear ribonucleoprotein A3 [Folsomia candida]|uniref:Uncharacterized protein n=1 Tax=Folsomia candida TaxID=158441 RepID=A0A226D6S0_FOLCA|nr:heterogeneous nuclear ribonucleoprotein A3 [Folsomia candida]OXA40558.1 hypothetical protein Fcan01_24625 [Folsomia candida]
MNKILISFAIFIGLLVTTRPVMGGNLKDLKAESTFGFGYGGLGIDGYAGGGGGGYYGNGWNNNFGGGYGFRGNGGWGGGWPYYAGYYGRGLYNGFGGGYYG